MVCRRRAGAPGERKELEAVIETAQKDLEDLRVLEVTREKEKNDELVKIQKATDDRRKQEKEENEEEKEEGSRRFGSKRGCFWPILSRWPSRG